MTTPVLSDPTPSPPPTPALPGSLRPVRCLARGPLAEVWEAVPADGDGPPVAVKILTVVSPGALRRLAREARLLASLSSPHVRGLREVLGQSRPEALVLDYVDGADLGRLAGAGPVPPRIAAWTGVFLARALACLHAHGWVHRDVKPGNVLVSRAGRLLLADLGQAWPTGVTDPPDEDEGAGTPSYLSPERLDGHPADARSDLWSCGVLLYRLLAGRLPFCDGPDKDLFELIRSDDPPPLPEVPGDLGRIVLGCLQKRPDDRTLDADHLRADLERYLGVGGDGERELAAFFESRGGGSTDTRTGPPGEE